MGISLHPIGNHNISFKNRSFKEIVEEIKHKLDVTRFPNELFLRRFALRWHSFNPRTIREIKNKKKWTYYEENEYFNFDEKKEIEFEGPFSLSLLFTEHHIRIYDPPYRYFLWFDLCDEKIQNEWRKYIKHIVNLFGGNRVLYAADSGCFLEYYAYYEDNFETMEKELLEKYGKPKKRIQDIQEIEEGEYFIDDFSTIDWSITENYDEFSTESNDFSSISFDVEYFSKKENLKPLNFDDKLLVHKKIKNEIHFFHLVRKEGLLGYHKGIVGKKEDIEIKLDKHAPFTFDKIVEQQKEKGFSYQYDISFTIRIKGEENIDSWREPIKVFEKELPWNGLGGVTGSSFGEKINEYWYYTVNEKLALNLLLNLGKKYNAFGKIRVFRNGYNITWPNERERKNAVLIYEKRLTKI